ncbi:MAG: flagellar biosynthetic protein FliR [Planctomycetia bacterium]|nr:flagellar biosynthetic protein FliR [Planctomycetia bacterium]
METLIFPYIRLFLLLTARCFGMIRFAPGVEQIELNRSTRVVFSVLLALLLYPQALACAPATALSVESLPLGLSTLLAFALDAAVEFTFGALVSFVVKIVFGALFLAGELIARVGGIAVAGVFDETLGSDATPVSRLLFWTALALFAAFGGLEILLDSFLTVCERVEVGASYAAFDLAPQLCALLTSSFALALKLSATVLVASLIVYFAIGCLGRIAPQINLMASSLNLNALLTLGVLTTLLGVCLRVFQDGALQTLESLASWFA